MEVKRLRFLLDELEYHLNTSPIEDDCSDLENRMYSDMANLKATLEDLDIDQVKMPKRHMFARAKEKHDRERKQKRLMKTLDNGKVSIKELDAKLFMLESKDEDDINRYVSFDNEDGIDEAIEKILRESESITDFCELAINENLPINIFEEWDWNYL